MPTTLFLTLPVADPVKSMKFYEALGFERDPRFPDGSVSCVALNDKASVMLASREQFAQISPKPLADPANGCQVLLSLTCDSREAVDTMVASAIAAGGSQAHEPEDYGFMYQHAFYDLDGHGWGLTWVNPEAAK